MKKRRSALFYGCMAALGLVVLIWAGIGLLNLAINPMSLTASFRDRGRDLAHPKREFDESFDGNFTIYEGRYGGRGKGGLRSVQFEGVLAGEDRLLEIRFPETILEEATISESTERMEGEPCALLMYQRFCCMPMEYTYAFLDLEVGASSDPAALLDEHFGYELEGAGDRVVLCTMDFSNTFNHTTKCYVWERGPDGMVLAALGGSVVVPYDMDIGWRVRDRESLRWRKALYAGTVLADVATGPLQLAFVLLIGQGMVR
jgi:hypothetical protein